MSKTQASAAPSTPHRKPRQGMQRVSGDVVGFHDCETQGPLFGIPRAAKLSDNGQDETKPSCFVIFEALEDTKAVEGSGDEAHEVQVRKGEMVGLWLKAGMKAIRNLCGLPVEVFFVGEKKLKGRPASQKPMKVFEFDVGAGKGAPIPVIEDNRKQSRNAPTMFDAPKVGREPGEDDLEF